MGRILLRLSNWPYWKIKYETYNSLKSSTNDRQKQVLAYIDTNKSIQIKDVLDYSRNTLKKDLHYLVQEGFVLTTSSGRGVRYHDKKNSTIRNLIMN